MGQLRSLLVALLLVPGLAVGAAGQQAPAPATRPAPKPPPLASGDREFVKTVVKGGMAEVALGDLASTRASDDTVKKFGQRMVEDHGKANQQLTQLAGNKGVELPKEVDRTQKSVHDRLAKLTGQAFDRAYVEEMVKDHRKDVKEFERHSARNKDPELKAWVDKTLPTLRDHLREIENISVKILAKK